MGGFPKFEVNKDYGMLGLCWGPPYYGYLPYVECREPGRVS